ncbi:MAG: hypothetical protein K2M97_07355 [Muribaculaceae bacterium]|nr:hypothetical protein [Muribaculaceae bacterium]
MESVETLIPDNQGNHLVVALNFCDDIVRDGIAQIPSEFCEFEIADISIRKLYLDKPLNIRAFFKMCNWLMEQLTIFSNTIFWFICSTEELATNHSEMTSAQYRWQLFDLFYHRNITELRNMGIESKEIIVGSENKTYMRVFYRMCHAPVIHVVSANIINANDAK